MLRILLFLGLMCLAGEARAEWWRAETSNFVIQADMPEAELRKLAIELETLDGVMRALAGAAGKANPRRSDILIFDDVETVRRLSGLERFVGGVTLQTGAGEMVLAAQGFAAIGADRDPRRSVFHEYAHSFMRRHIGNLMPGWFSEGYASYFETAEVVDADTVRLGAMPPQLEQALTGGIVFADVMTLAASNPDGPPPAKIYAEGWLLTHHFLARAPRSPEILRYLNAVSAGEAVDKPDRFFTGGIAGLDAEMAAYFAAKPGAKAYAAKAADAAEAKLRPMREGEVRFATLRVEDIARSKASAGGRAARAKAAQERLAAAKALLGLYPEETEAALFAATLALDDNDTALAGTLADKLLATAPDKPELLALKADVLTVTARNDPPRAIALIRAGRELLRRAAAASPDDPAVAAALYRNFSADQGASMETRRYLDRAIELNPDNDELRNTAIDFALRTRDTKYAIALLTPLANSPHETPRKHGAIKAIAEIRKTFR
jgi:hypothetical protein